MIATSTLEKSLVNTRVVYFGKVLKCLIEEELDANIAHVEYPVDFKTYMDNEPLLNLPGVIMIEVDENFDCFDQVRYIKSHPFLHGLIVILLGIKENKEWRRTALQLQVNDYYTYPFPLDDLYERINFLVKLKLIKPKITQMHQQFSSKYEIPLYKRLVDVVISGIALIFLAPLFLAVALLIRMGSKGAIIYKSKRVGAGYKIFNFYKFRSMRSGADALLSQMANLNQYTNEEGDQGGRTAFVKFKNDPRITKIGAFLRKTSIDELPQLINVLIGDMSLVGNRPLPLYEAEQLTTDEWATRFNGPAGLTGLWQISKRGKSDMSDIERKELDNYYATNYSILLDLKIILKTFPAMIQKEQV